MYKKHWYIRRSSLIPSDPIKVSNSNDRRVSGENTVDPRVGDNCRSFWQTQFGYLGLYPFILQCNLLDQHDFLQVSRTMDVWAQSYITLYPLLGQVDYGLVKFILAVMLSAIG